MKQSRSKPSRSTRKQERERRGHALQHGLPAAEPQPSRRVVAADPAPYPYREASAGTSQVVSSFARAPVETLGWKARLDRIPPSLKLLGAGIVVLIAIGLYRRYTEERGVYPTEAETLALSVPSVQAPVPSVQAPVPSVQAPVPSVQAPAATETRTTSKPAVSVKAVETEKRQVGTKVLPKTATAAPPSGAKAPTPVNALPVSTENPY